MLLGLCLVSGAVDVYASVETSVDIIETVEDSVDSIESSIVDNT